MRNLLRVGAVVLTAGSTVLGAAVAAQAAPDAITVTVNRLILEPQQYGHEGTIRIAIRNGTTEPYDGSVTITEPIPATLVESTGTGACTLGRTEDDRGVSSCGLAEPIAPGETGFVTVSFRSPAQPQDYAQVAPLTGSVEAGGITATFPALFRATTGSLVSPRPYVQDTVPALTVTAGDAVLTQQADGTFAGRVPVTVRNNGDAPARAIEAQLATPASVSEWPTLDGSATCRLGGDLPETAGSQVISCDLVGSPPAEGEERTFEWQITAPAGTAPGVLGTGTTLFRLVDPTREQASPTNIATFAITAG